MAQTGQPSASPAAQSSPIEEQKQSPTAQARPRFFAASSMPAPLKDLNRKLNTLSKKSFWRVVGSADFSPLATLPSMRDAAQLFVKQSTKNPLFTEMYAVLLGLILDSLDEGED